MSSRSATKRRRDDEFRQKRGRAATRSNEIAVVSLAYFDRYPLDSWPLTQVGVILWSLSASAHDWLPRETLTRLCASPVIGVLESQWDFGSSAMEARILRPLVCFGLLESRTEPRSSTEVVDRRLYRKAPLFDRFVKFDVQIEGSGIRR